MRLLWGLAFLGLSSCLTLGQHELPETKLKSPLVNCEMDIEASTLDKTELSFKVEQQPVKILSTAKSPWKTHLRYVYPYDRNTLQFEVNVKNNGKTILGIGDSVSLLQNEKLVAQALPLSFFKQLWPESAIQTENQLNDRSMAMGEVLQHRWHARTLYPGESYTGRVIFKSVEIPTEATLSFSVITPDNNQTQEKSVCLTPRS